MLINSIPNRCLLHQKYSPRFWYDIISFLFCTAKPVNVWIKKSFKLQETIRKFISHVIPYVYIESNLNYFEKQVIIYKIILLILYFNFLRKRFVQNILSFLKFMVVLFKHASGSRWDASGLNTQSKISRRRNYQFENRLFEVWNNMQLIFNFLFKKAVEWNIDTCMIIRYMSIINCLNKRQN